MTVVDPAVRRMATAVLFFMALVVGFGVWRGERLTLVFGQLLAGLLAGGLVIGCYIWARRND